MIEITDNILETIKEWGQGLYDRIAGVKKGFDESQEKTARDFHSFSKKYFTAMALVGALTVGTGYLMVKSHDNLVEAIASRKPAAAQVQPGLESRLQVPEAAAKEQAVQFVSGHLKAWQEGNWSQYFNNYADNCEVQTSKGIMDKQQLVDYKTGINQNNSYRKITVPGGFEVVVAGEQAIVRFRQQYSSSTYSDLSDKTIVLERQGEQWRIQKESYQLIR